MRTVDYSIKTLEFIPVLSRSKLKPERELMPRFIDLVIKYYQQIKDFLLLLLDRILHQRIETREL